MHRCLDDVILVAGHRGMVGSAIVRRLSSQGYQNILTAGRDELDLVNQAAVNAYFRHNKIDQVYLAAAKVGGFTPTIHTRLALFTTT